MNIIQAPSKHHTSRTRNKVTAIVLHHTVAKDSLAYLRSNRPGVSAHYLVDKKGTIYQLVKENRRAHHAGRSKMGNKDVNSSTIGIEVENLGNSRDSYPEAQLKAVADLCKDIISRYPDITIVPHRLIDTKGKVDPSLDWNDMMKRIYASTRKTKDTLAKELRDLFKKHKIV